MDHAEIKGFWVGPWLVEPDSNKLADGDRFRKLEPKTMAVLVHLAKHAGLVISREELLSVVWDDSFVTENTLSRTISRLRRALGDDWQQPHFLETISKTGYRLIAPVRSVFPGGPDLALESPSSASANTRRKTKSWQMYALIAGVLAALVWWGATNWPSDRKPLSAPVVKPAVTLIGPQANPVISPDGHHVAFAWKGHDGANWDIYVQAIGADNPRRLTDGSQTNVLPAWSPDGRFLAFLSGGEGCGIYRVPLTGGPIVHLAGCIENIRHLDWSPDGNFLAYDGLSPGATKQGIHLLELGEEEPRLLIEPGPDGAGDWEPVFSPKGEQLAFLRRETADLHHIYLTNREGKMPVRITRHEAGRIRGLDWTADGEALVYSYNNNGRFALWRIDVRGGTPERLPITDDWVTYPSLSHNGEALIYKNYADVTDLWSLTLEEGGTVESDPEKVVPSTRSELYPRQSPDGTRLAFLSNRTGAFEVWTGEPSGAELIRHTDLEGVVARMVDWSRDGTELVYEVRRNGQSDLFLVGASGRSPTALTETPWDEVNPRFGRKGIYHGSKQTGDWQIWRLDTEPGTPTQLTHDGGFFAQEGPRGEFVYYSRLNQPGIYKVPLNGGEEALVWQGLGPIDWGNWQVCKNGLYFVNRGDNSLVFQPEDGGPPRQVYRAPTTISYLGTAFHVSPDERRIFLTQITQSDDEIMFATLR